MLLQLRLQDLDGVFAEFSGTTFYDEALTLLEKTSLDLVVLDLQLPDCEGEELLRRVVSLASDTPVIAISGHPESFLGFNVRELGAITYIRKDVLLDEGAFAKEFLPAGTPLMVSQV